MMGENLPISFYDLNIWNRIPFINGSHPSNLGSTEILFSDNHPYIPLIQTKIHWTMLGYHFFDLLQVRIDL